MTQKECQLRFLILFIALKLNQDVLKICSIYLLMQVDLKHKFLDQKSSKSLTVINYQDLVKSILIQLEIEIILSNKF